MPAWIGDHVQSNLDQASVLAVDRVIPPNEEYSNVVLLQSVTRAQAWNIDDDNVAVDEPHPTTLQLVGHAFDALRRHNDRIRLRNKADHDQRRRDRIQQTLDRGLRPALYYDDSLTFMRGDLPKKKALIASDMSQPSVTSASNSKRVRVTGHTCSGTAICLEVSLRRGNHYAD